MAKQGKALKAKGGKIGPLKGQDKLVTPQQKLASAMGKMAAVK